MFDRHQAEITVMQFTGYSLPVYQSMSVPWDFYLVPFFQPSPPTRFLLITAIGMCHFLPVHHFGMACFAGSKVSIQHRRPEEIFMGVIYDTFDILTPLAATEMRRSKRKKKATDSIVVNQKRMRH